MCPICRGTERALAGFARTLPQRPRPRRPACGSEPGARPANITRARHWRATWRSWAATTALYVGDDRTDEDAFVHPIPGLVSVRVGQKTGSHARFFLQEQYEVDRLLDTLLDARPDAR